MLGNEGKGEVVKYFFLWVYDHNFMIEFTFMSKRLTAFLRYTLDHNGTLTVI